jgi:RNA recognition motif-containing protein
MLFSKKLNIVDCDIHRFANNENDANAYAFAELGSEEEAKQAIELLNETEFMNRKLQVILF